ncbi:MAG: hypothetical protein JWR80_8562 [Bradyrhizobium sp.]|nr:hypothetical protein [Bradyrhizobium sp.]
MVDRPTDSDRWLTAAQALARVEARLGNIEEAAAAIIARARAGVFLAKAEVRTEMSTMRGKNAATSRNVNEPVPAWCWSLCVDPMKANWQTGDFSGTGTVGSRHVDLQLVGVQFHADNVEAAAPPPEAQPPLTHKPSGLRPDISIYAGGITWVDAAYDENMGRAPLGLLPAGPDAIEDTVVANDVPTLPRLPDSRLQQWWQGLGADVKALPWTTLIPLARSAFPTNFIDRERIRRLDPGRKRGNKAFGGNASAD